MGIDRKYVKDAPTLERCKLCFLGIVLHEASDGRFFEHPQTQGVFINLPKDFKIERCQSCRKMFLSEEDLKAVHIILDEELAFHAALIQSSAESFKAASADQKN